MTKNNNKEKLTIFIGLRNILWKKVINYFDDFFYKNHVKNFLKCLSTIALITFINKTHNNNEKAKGCLEGIY